MKTQIDPIISARDSEASHGKVVVYQGVSPNIGTTVISFSSAVMLAERTESQIGYICLNLKSSKLHYYNGIQQPHAVLDAIRADIKSRSLSAKSLSGFCHRPKGLHNLSVLYGNLLREQAEYYSVEDMDYLIKLCRETFDITVLEVNAYWDNAATLCALQQADYRVLISSDRLAYFQEDYLRWHGRLAPVLNLDSERGFLFVIRHRTPKSGTTIREISRFTGLPLIGSTHRYEEVEQLLEQGKIIACAQELIPLRNDLQSMVNMFREWFQVQTSPTPIKQSKLRKWLLKQYKVRGGTAT